MEHSLSIDRRHDALTFCELPQDLHPLAANTLEAFLRDEMPLAEFARFFSLANSTYISITDCILAYLEPATATAALF